MLGQTPQQKSSKEQFVSNLEGTTKLEVFQLVMVLPLSCFIATWTTTALGLHRDAEPKLARKLLIAFVEALVLVAPQIALVTELLAAAPTFYTLLALWAALVVARGRQYGRMYAEAPAKGLAELHLSIGSRRKGYISAMRGGTLLLSALCILAVDFPAFPRRLAKAERHGTGLMDLGVGLLLACSALVSRHTRTPSGPPLTWNQRLGVGIRAAASMWVLGFGRLLATSAVSYQVHVGEYGVHWNFFLTMAVVLLVTHALAALPAEYLAVPSRMLLLGHQALLAYGADKLPLQKATAGISKWVHSEERGQGLLEANKEGIASLPGYLGLFLFAAQLGAHLQASPKALLHKLAASHASRAPLAPLWSWLFLLTARAASYWGVAALLAASIEAPSRRACNAAYVAWVLGTALAALLALLLTELFAAPCGRLPRLLAAVNRNMLPLFLLANVLTGSANLVFDTLAASALTARLVLGLYMGTLLLVAVVLDALDITIKL